MRGGERSLYLSVCMEGLNLEKLLREAAREGVTLLCVRRIGLRQVYALVHVRQYGRLAQMCAAHGWNLTQTGAGMLVRAARFLRRRLALAAGMLLCVAAVWLSSGMILRIRIDGARENAAEVRRFLAEEGMHPGRFKSAFSTDSLRARMALRLPGLAFAGLSYEGSTLVIDCHPAHTGEMPFVPGEGMDIVAAQDGIVTRISAASGTPLVKPGDPVRRGQTLVAGYERTQDGGVHAVRAQAQVTARMWARGSARVRMTQENAVETGAQRRKVVLRSLWHERVVRDAQPFASQAESTQRQMVVGLYLPLWREITTYAQTVTVKATRSKADAASWAQGAAEEIAKKECPFGVLILDKSVQYSMIDNEFLYAAVVLEYEGSIAARLK